MFPHTIATPSTLIVGLWEAAESVTVKASLRTVDGEIVCDVCEASAADAWQALALTLEELRQVNVRNLVILTNSREISRALRSKRAPEPTEKALHRLDWKEAIVVPYGGDANHWRALRLLAGCYRWTVQYVEREA